MYMYVPNNNKYTKKFSELKNGDIGMVTKVQRQVIVVLWLQMDIFIVSTEDEM